jgi:hypothetical protein
MSEQRSLVSGDQYLAGLVIFFYQAVRKQLLLVILVPLAVMAITFFASQQLSPIYAGQASVRIGRVDGTEAISLQAAVARINSQAFKERVLRSMNLPTTGDDPPAQLIFGSLTARPETSDSLVVSVRADSNEHLRQGLQVTVRLLNDEQEKIQGPVFEDLRAQLTVVDANIAKLSETRESLLALTKASIAQATPGAQPGGREPVALQSVFLSDLVSRNEERLFNARTTRLALAARLNSWKTYPTTIVDDIFVSRTPIFPRSLLMTFFAGGVAFLGLLLYALLLGRKAVHPS